MQFKDTKEVIVQDIPLTTDNVLFRKSKKILLAFRGKNLFSGTAMVTKENLVRNKSLSHEPVLRGDV